MTSGISESILMLQGNRWSEELWDMPLTLRDSRRRNVKKLSIFHSTGNGRMGKRGQQWMINSCDRSSCCISQPLPEK